MHGGYEPASSRAANRQQKLFDLVQATLRQPSEQRAAFLDTACVDDPELLQQVRGLLRKMDHSAGTYAAGDPTTVSPSEPRALTRTDELGSQGTGVMPERIGSYRLLEVLGQGGMGTVYLAEQTEPIHRQVAVKVTRPHPRSERGQPEYLRLRFELERRALARMSHSHIARVYEAGDLDDGRPYIVMEYVPGVQLDQYCDRHKLDVEARIALVLQVCSGIHHAHQKGVLHRDIKPANLLVHEQDGKPIVKVLDFGIAKDLDAPADAEQLTIGVLLGTPAFVSPEAAAHTPGSDDDSLDIRSDVYALGVLLHLLLIGQLPHAQEGDVALMEYLDRVARHEPPLLSSCFERLQVDRRREVAEQRATTAIRLQNRLRGDLDRIVAKALAVERSRRYGSAAELADDLRRFLAFEPVQARPPGRLYLLRRFVRRNRAAVAAVVLVLVTLVGGVIARGHEARKALQAQTEAQAVTDFLLDLFEDARPPGSVSEEVTLRQVLDRGAVRIDQEFTGSPVVRARLLTTLGRVYVELGLADTALPRLEEALALYRQQAAPSALDLGTTLRFMADSTHLLGDYPRARELFAETVRVFSRGLPETRDELAQTYFQFGRHHAVLGRPAEARQQLQEAQSLWSTWLPDNAELVLLVRREVAFTRLREGEHEAAYETFLEVLQQQENLPGANEVEISNTMALLAVTCIFQHRHAEAEPWLHRALEITRRRMGPEHPTVATHLTNLGEIYQATLRYDMAREVLEEALQLKLRVLGEDHIKLAPTLELLAGNAVDLGRPSVAIDYQERLVRLLLLRLEPANPEVHRARQQLIDYHEQWGQLERAEFLRLQEAPQPIQQEGGIPIMGRSPAVVDEEDS